MRKTLIAIVLSLISANHAAAGFLSWTAETEDDPFSKGKRVTVNFMSTIRSGVILICDSAEKGFMLRAIPGFAYEEVLTTVVPEIEVAIDGERLLGQTGATGSVGDNLAAAQVTFTPENAETFLAAFEKARKQIAIKDGISDRPHLLTARGSTKAAKALRACLDLQTKA